ncbi:MAG: NADH-quinone oxidoreductase subunit M [Puniceicoccales bacterium]|jgi:NADH-quinone oxidoreductase subunit M|nr:NADH-quinone oxidoreductase subunit M [Puniceicoccales bacterium]
MSIFPTVPVSAISAAAAGSAAADAPMIPSMVPLLALVAPALFALALGCDLVAKGAFARAETEGDAPKNPSLPYAVAASALPLIFVLAAYLLRGGASPALVTGSGVAGADAFLGIDYSLVLDGKALLMVALTGAVAPLALYASRAVARPLLFNTLFLLMESAALGVFLSRNFFAWFLFWELSLVPAFFLVKLWGGAGAPRAAMQFVIYTVGGSAFMLAGFAALFAATGTWDFAALADGGAAALAARFGAEAPLLAFLGVLLGLAVKVPLFPLHTWLPDTYAEAPAGVSIFLTAVMSKMGLFGFMVVLAPVFPAQLAACAPWLLVLALGGVLLGAFAALRQRDIKRMVAYSSVNHLGYCLLALFAAAPALGAGTAGDAPAVASALNGAWLQMFNHGLSAAALFFCAGVLESRSGGLRGTGDFGGLRAKAPVFALLCGVALFSSLGLPGLNGFAGEFLIFRGVFALAPWAAAAATLGLLATAVFLLTFWQKVFHGPAAGAGAASVGDLTAGERVALGVFAALMLLFGVCPQLLLNLVAR